MVTTQHPCDESELLLSLEATSACAAKRRLLHLTAEQMRAKIAAQFSVSAIGLRACVAVGESPPEKSLVCQDRVFVAEVPQPAKVP